jgi:dTDP-4-dehydrorhamnose 3,5-epimerase
MKVTPSTISDVLIIEPHIHRDERGYFFEAHNLSAWSSVLGADIAFVQDNYSVSKKGVIRGLHYQLKHVQGKLIRVCEGSIFDVAVDLRKNSETFGQWVGRVLSAENNEQHWVPPGFAHGFMVLSEHASVLYKTTDYWNPQSEHCIRWDDPTLAIDWPKTDLPPILSEKDSLGLSWVDSPKIS